MSRIGLGCMRLSTDADRNEDRAVATIEAALAAGTSWLDTARAYAPTPMELGHSERLIARVVSNTRVRITTKCGMARPEGRWEPDGRAASILSAARASAHDLGRPPDLLLLHAPDPRVELATSVRAIVRAKKEGLARAIGLSNVSRKELEALGDVEIDAVQVALGAFDDEAARGGVVAWCNERRILLQAHSPLGGPKRASRLARDHVLRRVAARHENATPAMIVIAYLLALSDNIVPIVAHDAPRPQHPRSLPSESSSTPPISMPSTLGFLAWPGRGVARSRQHGRPPRPISSF